MWFWYFVVFVLFPFADGVHQEPDPREILGQADLKIASLTSITFQVEAEETSDVFEPARFSGEVAIVRSESALLGGRVAVKGTVEEPVGSSSRRIKAICDGLSCVRFLDQFKLLMSASSEREAKRLLSINGAVPFELLEKAPFADDRAKEDLTYLETQTIGETICHVVSVPTPVTPALPRNDDNRDYLDGARTTWYFGVQDGLPRRIEKQIYRLSGGKEGPVTIAVNLSDLKVNPEIEADRFNTSTPEGWRVADQDSVVPDTSSLLDVGVEAPDWELLDAEGKRRSLSQQTGRLVVMDFWATWCGPCKIGMPHVQALHDDFADKGVTIFGVNALDDGDPVGYVKKMKYTYPQLLEADDVASRYGVTSFPTFFVVGRDGKVLYRGTGSDKIDEVRSVIESELDEVTPSSHARCFLSLFALPITR